MTNDKEGDDAMKENARSTEGARAAGDDTSDAEAG